MQAGSREDVDGVIEIENPVAQTVIALPLVISNPHSVFVTPKSSPVKVSVGPERGVL